MMGEVVQFDFLISRKLDPIYDRLSNGGLEFYFIDGKHFKFLTFEIRDKLVTPDAWQAAYELNKLYKTDAESKESLEYYAYTTGAVYDDIITYSVPNGGAA